VSETRTRRGSRPNGRVASTSMAPRSAAALSNDVVLLVDGEGTDPATPDAVVLARLVDDGEASGKVQLELASGSPATVKLEDWERAHVSLKSLLRDELAALDSDDRQAVLDRLAGSVEPGRHGAFDVSASLHAIREVLRDRLPRCAITDAQPVGLAVEEILAIDQSSFWVKGWVHDEDGLGEVTVVSPEGVRTSVSEGAFRYERPDVAEFYATVEGRDRQRQGFTAYVVMSAPSRLPTGWVAELRTSDGVRLEVDCPTVVRDRERVRTMILNELGQRGSIGGELTASHARAALSRLQERVVGHSSIRSIDVYGSLPDNPAVSIVVPLYKRLDFMEHQLLQFSRDPELADCELTYVLDSPEQSNALATQAKALFALHGVSFQVVNLTASAGFAGANAHGIGVSRADVLLLLNSDVIPDRPGWIGEMRAFYEATPDIGALGPKLLYEDDSLQHAGLYFYRAPGSPVWENAHCFKGLHRSFPAANVARPVPAVTAACMLVDRALYEQAGGLPQHYVQGDYEDSELCIRIGDLGRTNWYLPSVELYHLEGQSYVPGARQAPSEYNMWLHTHMWGDRLEKLMDSFDPFDPGTTIEAE
jgi:GT2 family glycosyltransferase